jgi:hypothetical protein
MKKLIVAAALASVMASPAFAQSYDPDIGSGNLTVPMATQTFRSDPMAAFAQVHHAPRAAVHVRNGGDPDPFIR